MDFPEFVLRLDISQHPAANSRKARHPIPPAPPFSLCPARRYRVCEQRLSAQLRECTFGLINCSLSEQFLLIPNCLHTCVCLRVKQNKWVGLHGVIYFVLARLCNARKAHWQGFRLRRAFRTLQRRTLSQRIETL